MTYDPKIHHRQSFRLDGYDYSQEGAYFVTICTQGRTCLFGEVVGETVRLSDAGEMIERWWRELPHKFPAIETDAYVVMPNHLHGIVVIVGADLRVCPDSEGAHTGAPLQNASPNPSLSRVVQWFKTMTTNDYIRGVKQGKWKPFAGRLWQRNYYEHIIRSEESLNTLRLYIEINPARWADDENNPTMLYG